MADGATFHDDGAILLKVKKRYERWREHVDERLTSEDRLLLRHAINVRKPISILDVGCGYGRIMELLKKERKCDFIVGLDIAESLLKRAKRISNSDVILASLTHLPFRDKAFDVCLCIYGPLNHVPLLLGGLRELARVCKWRLVFSLYNKFHIYYMLSHVKHRIIRGTFFSRAYHIRDVMKALDELGLKLVFWRGQILGSLGLHTFAKLIAIVADVPLKKRPLR